MRRTISEKLAQQIVETVKSVCGYDINYIDPNGYILASTNEERIGTYHAVGRRTVENGTTVEVTDSEMYPGSRPGINIPVFHNRECVAVIGISGQPDAVRPYAELAQRVTNLLIREQEMNTIASIQKEQCSYILNALLQREIKNPEYLDELLDQFHVDSKTQKRVILINFYSGLTAIEADFLEQRVLACFKQLGISLFIRQYPNDFLGVLGEEMLKKAQTVLRKLAEEECGRIRIAVGKAVGLRELYLSDDSARIALRSGVESASAFVMFDDLSLELILFSLNRQCRQEFLKKTILNLDESEVNLLQVYFSRNMSLTETAKVLFIHKNTVQYRLNHIAEITKLNPRIFQEAVLLYLAVMIKNRTVF